MNVMNIRMKEKVKEKPLAFGSKHYQGVYQLQIFKFPYFYLMVKNEKLCVNSIELNTRFCFYENLVVSLKDKVRRYR